MEATSSRPLAVESFSDSWLSNVRPSLINLIENEEYSSTRNSFDFDTPIYNNAQQTRAQIHADEIFSNGLIKPIFAEPITSTEEIIIISSKSLDVSSPIEPRNNINNNNNNNRFGDCDGGENDNDAQMGCSCCFRTRRRVLYEKLLQRVFRYLGKRSKLKKSTKVDDIDRRTMEIKSLNNSPQASPGTSSYYDVESSIQEAVLHCKRSIGK